MGDRCSAHPEAPNEASSQNRPDDRDEGILARSVPVGKRQPRFRGAARNLEVGSWPLVLGSSPAVVPYRLGLDEDGFESKSRCVRYLNRPIGTGDATTGWRSPHARNQFPDAGPIVLTCP